MVDPCSVAVQYEAAAIATRAGLGVANAVERSTQGGHSLCSKIVESAIERPQHSRVTEPALSMVRPEPTSKLTPQRRPWGGTTARTEIYVWGEPLQQRRTQLHAEDLGDPLTARKLELPKESSPRRLQQ